MRSTRARRKKSTFKNRNGANVRSALGYSTNQCRCKDCRAANGRFY